MFMDNQIIVFYTYLRGDMKFGVEKEDTFFVLRLLPIFLMAISCSPSKNESKIENHQLFFENLSYHCGNTYFGEVITPLSKDDSFHGKRLTMTIESCDSTQIRIPFWVGEDKSRTWVFTLIDGNLLFKHDHRHEDGSPDEITNYGGWADSSGTAFQQRFPADQETADLIPEASTNTWTLLIDEKKNEFLYVLERDNKERFRAKFFLK